MRLIFMGTPSLAVPALQAIVDSAHKILAVVTQPDRPKGRGYYLAPSAVKECALKNNLPLYQPEKVGEVEFIKILKELEPELIVVVAFGQILPQEILNLPNFGCLNVHASLLPKYRGAAPIEWALIRGEEETGVTIIYMSERLDAGDIILQRAIKISREDTVESLKEKLALLGAEALKEALRLIEERRVIRRVQDESLATYAPSLSKRDGLIQWNKSALEIHNLVRGTNPWPGAYTTFEGRRLKIKETEVIERTEDSGQPGKILAFRKGQGWIVATGKGQILIKKVQPEGGRVMLAEEYSRGHKVELGNLLGM